MTDSSGGVLPVDKPSGPTSHDVVDRVRRVLDTRRVGHTGTLDPFASGLLLLCVGSATRLSEYLTGLPKEYVAVARLGEVTRTDDSEGGVVRRSDAWTGLDEDAVREAMTRFRGSIVQRPPAYSAKKVAGVPAHRRVRRGEVVELEPVTVEVHALELEGFRPPEVTFRVRCSSGTYVRALARDLGEELETGAHLTALRRVAVGSFLVDDALPLAEMEEGRVDAHWISPSEAVGHMPRFCVDDDGARRLAHGQRIEAGEAPGADDGPVAVVHDGRLLAVAEVEDHMLRPRKVFA